MYLQMLPHACVALLDAMALKAAEGLELALELFQQERHEFLTWIDLHGALPGSQSEHACVENLRVLWLELEKMLEDADLFGALDKMYQVYGLRAEIQRERWRRGFCGEETVNGALLAAEQVICQGLPCHLLEVWNGPLQAYFQQCWERALQCGCLPLEDRGFRAFQQGLELWTRGPALAELEECMRWLAWGSNQIESLLAGLLPGFLTLDLQGPPSSLALDEIYNGFLELWEGQLQTGCRRRQLLDELEDLLGELELAAEPAECSRLQQRLNELWGQSRREALPIRPEGLSENLLFDALQGHLDGHVPRLVLQRMAQDFCAGPRVRRELLLYLQSGEVDALERLVELLLQPVEVAPISLALVA